MRQLFGLLFLLSFACFGQQAEPVLFGEKTHDFGEISEEGGAAVYDFVFTNNAARIIRIISVKPSCGCTTPDWSKEQVLPGKTGFIRVSFDPKGRPGFFSKNLVVTTDYDGAPISLVIRGQVMAKGQAVDMNDYPIQYGVLRFKSSAINFGKIFINQPATSHDFAVVNTGTTPVAFTSNHETPAYIKVDAPKSIAPGERSLIHVTYDAKLRNRYGFVMDNIILNTNDQAQPQKSFSVYATIEEFFPVMSKEELNSAPVLRTNMQSIEMGRMKQGTVVDKQVILSNPGRKPLEIRYIQPNCSCVIAIAEGSQIKPRSQVKLNISFVSQGKLGIQQKAVTIYTNDPVNPVQRITLSAVVDNP